MIAQKKSPGIISKPLIEEKLLTISFGKCITKLVKEYRRPVRINWFILLVVLFLCVHYIFNFFRLKLYFAQ